MMRLGAPVNASETRWGEEEDIGSFCSGLWLTSSRRDVPSVPVSVLQGTNSLRGYVTALTRAQIPPGTQGTGGTWLLPES